MEQRGRRACWSIEMTTDMNVPLSVLDLAPVGARLHARATRCGTPSSSARDVERLGYHRYWVAEHHNMPGIASSSPPVLLAHLAGVDLDDPRRLGRRDAAQPRAARGRRAVRHARGAAPGPHRPRHRPGARHRPGHRARAAARSASGRPPTTSPSSSASCSATSTGTFPADHPYRAHHRGARPRLPARDLAARLERLQRPHAAGVLGLPFSFAHHFAPAGTDGRARTRTATRSSRRPTSTRPT